MVKFDIEKAEKYMYKEEEYKENKLLGVLTDNKCQGIPSTVFVFPKTNSSVLESGFKNMVEMKALLVKYKEKGTDIDY